MLAPLRPSPVSGGMCKNLKSSVCGVIIINQDSASWVLFCSHYSSVFVPIRVDKKYLKQQTVIFLCVFRLQHLSLSKNGFFIIPQLMLIDGRHVTQESDAMKKSMRKGRSGRSSRVGKRQKSNISGQGILYCFPNNLYKLLSGLNVQKGNTSCDLYFSNFH